MATIKTNIENSCVLDGIRELEIVIYRIVRDGLGSGRTSIRWTRGSDKSLVGIVAFRCRRVALICIPYGCRRWIKPAERIIIEVHKQEILQPMIDILSNSADAGLEYCKFNITIVYKPAQTLGSYLSRSPLTLNIPKHWEPFIITGAAVIAIVLFLGFYTTLIASNMAMMKPH